jgi:hypothetical protein
MHRPTKYLFNLTKGDSVVPSADAVDDIVDLLVPKEKLIV